MGWLENENIFTQARAGTDRQNIFGVLHGGDKQSEGSVMGSSPKFCPSRSMLSPVLKNGF